jgi:malonyl-CoA O-methyltransferase
MNALSVREGYRLWAPTYSDETAISFLDNKLVLGMTPPLAGLRLLDAGCGTARRVRSTEAGSAVALDASEEMLAAGMDRNGPLTGIRLVVGDVRDMPLPDRSFDIVWCRLVLGHLPSIEEAYAELARVADFGATIIVSDFHAEAVAAGHRRSFRVGGDVFALEHYVHTADDHIEAARAAGLTLVQQRDAAIGPDVRSYYESAGRIEAYPDHLGLPVVLALAFLKDAHACAC